MNRIEMRIREDSNLHGFTPLEPESSASANSATTACIEPAFRQSHEADKNYHSTLQSYCQTVFEKIF